MKILRKTALIVVGLLVVLVLVSFLLPSEVFIQRSVHIKASQAAVFAEVSNLRRFNRWSSWYKQDTAATYTYSGPESGGIGSEISWDGEIVKQGRMIIVDTVAPDSVMVEIYFGEDTNQASRADFYLSSAGPDSVKLTWIFKTSLGFNPIERYVGLMVEGFIAPGYEASLKALKSVIETSYVAVRSVSVELQRLPARRLLGLGGRYDRPEEADAAISATFEQIQRFVKSQNITAPTYASVYFTGSQENASVAYIAGILDEEHVAPKDFVVHILPAQQYLRAVHIGTYVKLPETQAVLQNEMKRRNLVLNGNIYESYPIHEDIEPDTSKWETHIYYPVAPQDE